MAKTIIIFFYLLSGIFVINLLCILSNNDGFQLLGIVYIISLFIIMGEKKGEYTFKKEFYAKN